MEAIFGGGFLVYWVVKVHAVHRLLTEVPVDEVCQLQEQGHVMHCTKWREGCLVNENYVVMMMFQGEQFS